MSHVPPPGTPPPSPPPGGPTGPQPSGPGRPPFHLQAARPASLADILAGESTVASAGASFQVGVADYFTLPAPSGPPRFTEGRNRLIGRAES